MVAPRAPVEVSIHELPTVALKHVQSASRVSFSRSLSTVSKSSIFNVYSVPEIDDLPLLDNESCTGVEPPSSNRPTVKPKSRKCRPIKFVKCSTQHPLDSNHDRLIETSPASKKPTSFFSSIYSSRFQRKHSNKSLPTENVNKFADSDVSSVFENELLELLSNETDATELEEYKRNEVSLFVQPAKRFLRYNSSYLRMFVAEKQMYTSGKVNRIYCSQFQYPRKDESTNKPMQLLDIPYKWRKLPPRRAWIQLN